MYVPKEEKYVQGYDGHVRQVIKEYINIEKEKRKLIDLLYAYQNMCPHDFITYSEGSDYFKRAVRNICKKCGVVK